MTLNTTNPSSLGFNPTRLNRIGTLMQRYVDQGKLPGFATLVARKGEIAYTNTCGYQDIAQQTPVALDTIFRIYSMTKPITSVALLMLYEQSLFDLHDPVSAYLPEFSEMRVDAGAGSDGITTDPFRPISIRHLLTHTAGLSYGGFGMPNPHWVDKLYDEADIFNREQTLAQMIKKIAALPLRFQPGETWHYSVATDVVGRLVEVLSGQSLADFIEERICQPLGMVDTAFEIDREKIGRFATLYTITPENPLAIMDQPETSQYLGPINAHSGGGGMVSTLGDYYRFCQCLLNKGELDGVRILGRKTVERMQMGHLSGGALPIRFEFSPPSYGLNFGLGVAVNTDIAQSGEMGSNGDYGWGGYAETYFWIDPQEELIAINMTQCIPSGFYPVRPQFRSAVYQALVD